ncbi:hypothetical protein JKP88DRAFT_253358 [Tribonema minus]|uniref:Phosphodiesterase n=1 Tax=Tribonema minus TaxID=303371 RepID=A0A836CMF4_9STRA|nr:hypothetical protein JKP88DRAFT_253358 [Tribonema minus]
MPLRHTGFVTQQRVGDESPVLTRALRIIARFLTRSHSTHALATCALQVRRHSSAAHNGNSSADTAQRAAISLLRQPGSGNADAPSSPRSASQTGGDTARCGGTAELCHVEGMPAAAFLSAAAGGSPAVTAVPSLSRGMMGTRCSSCCASLCSYLFDEHKYNLFAHFGFSKRHFTNYIVQIEAGYGSGLGKGSVSVYHNRRHMADVTQAVHYFMQVCHLGASLTDIEMSGLLLGAIVHDFKHPGRSNAFLIKTFSELSLVYNDVSVLENFHISEVQELKLNTNVVREAHAPCADWCDVSMLRASTQMEQCNWKLEVYSEAFRVLRQDRCNFMRNVDSAIVRNIRDTMIPLISPLMDRDTTAIADSRKGFINFLVKPLFKSWVSFLNTPKAQTCLTNLEVSEAMWVAKEKRGDDTLEALADDGCQSLLQHAVTLQRSRDGYCKQQHSHTISSVLHSLALLHRRSNGGWGGEEGEGGEGDAVQCRLDAAVHELPYRRTRRGVLNCKRFTQCIALAKQCPPAPQT